MSDRPPSRTVTVCNPQGLHARPADLFARLAGQFDAEITVVKDGRRVDGKSVLNILTLAAEVGTQLEIEAEGHDAESALEALVELVDRGFQVNETTGQQ